MAPLSCGLAISRIILLGFNVIFFLFGFTLLGFGIYLIASKSFDVAFFEDVNAQIIGGDAIQTVGIILLIVGLFTVFLSAFGGIGVLFKKKLFLYLYTICLLIVIVLELAAFITALSLRVRVRNSYEDSLWNIFWDGYVHNRTDVRKAVEKLEEKFECCGVDGWEDYKIVNYTTIPLSCYENRDDTKRRFDVGCAEAFIDWIWDIMPAISGVVGAVLILEIFGALTSCSLIVAVSHDSYSQIDHRS